MHRNVTFALAISILTVSQFLAAQQQAPQPSPRTAPAQPAQGTPTSTQSVPTGSNARPSSSAGGAALTQQVPNAGIISQQIQTEVALLRERVDVVAGRTNLLITILAAVLALGGITSVISWGRHEYSQSRRDRQSNELHALAVRGETASQQRSEEVHQTFLSSSKNTLDLVNATLTLAKEASERAAKAVEARAKSNLQKLDIESKELLASVPAQDDRALVADPARTATLRSLAQRIEGFEINRLVLPEEMQLSSECLFIRGMDFHLKQQYDDAFTAWKEVTHRNETPAPLRSLAWYWIGYEQNNLGLFAEASLSFQRALETAAGVRKFELQRILIESRFFNKEAEMPLLASLKGLLNFVEDNAEEGMDSIRQKILATIGNIHLQLGNSSRKAGREESEWKEQYNLAREHFEQADRKDKWALFGLAESLFWLGDEKAQDILESQVRPKAVDEEIRRIEPRTKVLAKTTELICCIRVPRLRTEVPAIYSQVTEALGRVEGRLTVYSQAQRRNVSKEEFRKDLNDLMDEYKSYKRRSQKRPTANQQQSE